MSEDLKIDAQSVQQIQQGMRSAIAELRDIGTGTGSVLGKGFSELSMTGMEAGHHGLSVDFEDFCERWEWGVRALIQDANTICAKLGIAAGFLWEEDQYIQGTMKIGVNSLIGNPHATEDEVTKQSWGDVVTPDAPDWSAESWDKAGDEMGQTWKDTGRSLVTEGMGGVRTDIMNDALGVDDDAFDQAVDDTFGPSPEERAAAGEGG
ncbi:hypothetical protein SRB5_25060 [Streptomyces sp. RB5]|uniref:Uncharacterized protein n=1 Tax=Streptomyces smaragdinus TaxID=2585196 RepID=A0A7K0CG58_9ACTN|nr:hypothetical protein [Streptomyces smaragdinus]MQY12373.1 hypothetical protein [Streptomyces smaragdinus]